MRINTVVSFLALEMNVMAVFKTGTGWQKFELILDQKLYSPHSPGSSIPLNAL